MPPTFPAPRTTLALVTGLALLSGIGPVDRYTWALEVAIVVGVAALLVALRRRFWPSAGLRRWLLVYAAVMLVGAHWTYGQAPPGEWAAELFGLERNHFDRLGHLFQGLVPVLAAREWMSARGTGHAGWALVAGLATLAFFELLEPVAAALAPAGLDFVQAQGDRLDTFWDCACAGLGMAAGLALPALVDAGQRATAPTHEAPAGP